MTTWNIFKRNDGKTVVTIHLDGHSAMVSIYIYICVSQL